MIYTLLGVFSTFYVCWILYLAIMTLYRAKLEKSLTRTQKVLGYPLLFVGYFVDFVTNMLATVIFLALPKETLLTSRLIRHKREGGWRAKVANWICTALLDNLDPTGCHCKE